MNSQVWWFVARSSGIIAWALLSASVVWGLLLSTKVSSTRVAERRLRPAWLLDLHRHLGGLAVIFTIIHLIGIVADSYVSFGWTDIFVPMASEWRPGAVAFGVVSLYLLIAVEATSLAIRRLPRPLWRWIHRASFVLYATATWHGISAGTDAGNQWFRAAAWASLVVVVGLTIRLVVTLRRRRSSVGSPAPVGALPPPTFAAPAPAPAPVALPSPSVVPAPPPTVMVRRPVPLVAAIPPLPGTVTEMMMPPTSIPPLLDDSPRTSRPLVAPPRGELVGVSSRGSGEGDLAPPRVDS